MKYNPDQRWSGVTYAQHGDDLMLLNLCEQLGIKNPSYLDLGAHHPENISNTKLLYLLGCRGVNVEANPHLMEAFYDQRPDDINVCAGVGPQNRMANFYMLDEQSGLNTFADGELESIGLKPSTIRQTILLTINQIVERYCPGGSFPDILLVDIEGLDYAVLASADFSASAPKIICVECRPSDTTRMVEMLRQQGFEPYCRMGENLFFIPEGSIIGM